MLTKSSALLALLLEQSCQSKSGLFAEWSVANEQCWQDWAWGDEGTWTSGLNQEPRAWAESRESNCSTLPLSSSVLILLPAKVGSSISWVCGASPGAAQLLPGWVWDAWCGWGSSSPGVFQNKAQPYSLFCLSVELKYGSWQDVLCELVTFLCLKCSEWTWLCKLCVPLKMLLFLQVNFFLELV